MITASNSERYKQIEEYLKLFSEDWIKQFNRIEEGYSTINFIKEPAFLSDKEFHFPKGMIVYAIYTKKDEKYIKGENGKYEPEIKYSVHIGATYKDRCISFRFNKMYSPEFHFRIE
jgi:hypothetical protein